MLVGHAKATQRNALADRVEANAMTHDSTVPSGPHPAFSSPATDEQERQTTFTILAPLDGSERAARALPVAEDFCKRLGGTIALVRILPVSPLPYVITPVYFEPHVYQQLVDDQEQLAREYLEQVAATLREQGIPTQIHLLVGDPASAIIDAIPALHVTLVVMTTHGRTGLARFAMGSVADRVVRSGAAPVLLVRSFSAGEPPAELRHALIPLDGSPLAELALFTVALRLAGSVLGEITLACAADPRDGPAGVKAAEEYLDETRRQFVERLNDPNYAITTHTHVGAPAASILACAHERACDLILMSTHGEAGIGRLAFGSVADRILRDGDQPILLVCPPRATHAHPDEARM
jgi:nucleotide-binding universal stress UspA family protein